ncbi:MAG: cell envelope integrity protein CreD [Chitinophagaceae bacterium]|nr:cell envelope integrity protein CreD [Chitinophagaceae bacterium]
MLIKINKIGTSLTFKGFITGFLILFMMIPALMVQDLVEERKNRQQEVIAEVSSKWADPQILTGPYLSVPYSQTVVAADGKTTVIGKTMIILPELLEVKGNIEPQFKRRSIYKVALYKSDLTLKGHFLLKDATPSSDETIHWEKALLCIGLSDTRGIEAQPLANFMDSNYSFGAGMPGNMLGTKGASVPVNLSALTPEQQINFNIPIMLRGSETFQVVPIGKTTSVHLTSPWASPSFTGKFLPEFTLDEKGFDAGWNVLHFNRDFPQIWKNQSFKAEEFSFGFSLLQPTDHYAKTMRSVKYAILFIGLTFGFFFLLEALKGHRVHPVQYILTGIALVIFYSLLLSFGEIIDFNIAYAIAALSTTGLITMYGKHLFATWKNAAMLGGFLGGLYAFIFILIQLEDTSLLAGSIGLFALVAIAMHLSRKIKWYATEEEKETTIIETQS